MKEEADDEQEEQEQEDEDEDHDDDYHDVAAVLVRTRSKLDGILFELRVRYFGA